MIIPSKGDWQCLGQTLNLHKFWSNKDFHMIFYSRESWNFIFLNRKTFKPIPSPCLPYCMVWSQHSQNIFLETLEIFWKIPKKFFFKIFTLGTFNGALKIIAHVKKSLLQGAEKAKNRPWPKKSIFSKSEISIPQSNHGKRNIKLMLVRP